MGLEERELNVAVPVEETPDGPERPGLDPAIAEEDDEIDDEEEDWDEEEDDEVVFEEGGDDDEDDLAVA